MNMMSSKKAPTLVGLGLGLGTLVLLLLYFLTLGPNASEELAVGVPDGMGNEEVANSEGHFWAIDAEPSNESEADSASSNLISSVRNVKELSVAFQNAESAIDANEIVQEAEQKGYRIAQDWRVGLDQLCLLEGRADSDDEEGNWHDQQRIRFCDGYMISQDFSSMDHLDLFEYYDKRHQSAVKESLLSQVAESDRYETSEVIEKSLREANHAEDISAAIELIGELYSETGESIWDSFGLLDGKPVNVYRVQASALSLYSCYEFGGCGPDSMQMLLNCSLTQVCEPHWHYEDLLRYGMSPLEFDLILEILRNLRNP